MPPPRTVRGFGLYEQLRDRRANIASLLAYVEDEDEPRRVEVPDVRNRYQRIKRVLDELPWTRVEMVNKKGEIIHVHKRCADDENPAGELEDLPGNGVAGQMSATLGVAVHWVLKAQEVALVRHQASVETVFEAQNRMIEATMKRFEQMDAQNAQLMRLNHALNGDLIAQQLAAIRKEASKVEGDAEGPISDAVVETVLPALVRKMMEPAHEPTSSGAKDGKRVPNGKRSES
jgi:hypothetical protein